MSVRPGVYGSLIGISQTLGSAAGRTYAVNNSSYAVLVAVRVLFTTTATVGNRTLVVAMLDAAGNVLYQVASGNLVASTPFSVSVGAGCALVSQANIQVLPSPVEMAVPPNSQVKIFDNGNVDVADTIQPNIVYAL